MCVPADAAQGQDTLIRAWPAVQRKVPDAALLIVGGGPYRSRLGALVAETAGGHPRVMTGRCRGILPSHYAAGDVFAMPRRDPQSGMGCCPTLGSCT